VGSAVELSDAAVRSCSDIPVSHSLHDVGLVFENGSLVGVYVEVVGRGEDRHDRGESGRFSLSVHSVSDSQCRVV